VIARIGKNCTNTRDESPDIGLLFSSVLHELDVIRWMKNLAADFSNVSQTRHPFQLEAALVIEKTGDVDCDWAIKIWS